jgi:8-oxo-dGTP pyrophosphatase MutT (NUDIX family)
LVFNETNQKVITQGLGVLDNKEKDLIEIIIVEDVLEAKYKGTGVFIPRTFAESLPVIPHHVTAQATFFSVATSRTGEDIQVFREQYLYGMTPSDNLWLENRQPTGIVDGELMMILNRRVGGWDGSPKRPVIELLCAGGHVPVCWNNSTCAFVASSPEETLAREIAEEVGLTNVEYTLVKLGGFINIQTSELVVLYAAFVDWHIVSKMQQKAFGNFSENINGLYFGEFSFVINNYLHDASSYAGGEETKPFNFPLQEALMMRVNVMVKKHVGKHIRS